jgi:hypothetical protein
VGSGAGFKPSVSKGPEKMKKWKLLGSADTMSFGAHGGGSMSLDSVILESAGEMGLIELAPEKTKEWARDLLGDRGDPVGGIVH